MVTLEEPLKISNVYQGLLKIKPYEIHKTCESVLNIGWLLIVNGISIICVITSVRDCHEQV